MYKMSFFDYLKIYFKRPSYIISDIKNLYYKRLKKNIEKKRLQVYEYDCRCLCYNVDNVFNEDENNYIICVNSQDAVKIGRGSVKMKFIAHIPDYDFSDGFRTEIVDNICTGVVIT
jgi:hypothetical protein